MKCHKPNTDQRATVKAYMDDYECPEYILPSGPDSDPNTVECFIALTKGEKITIKGKFDGTVYHGAIDLLVDGSFVRRSGIEGEAQIAKSVNRKLQFIKVFNVPEPPECDDVRYRTPVVEGDLIVRDLESHPLKGTAQTGYGVGSIVVIISINEQPADEYTPTPPYSNNITIGRWKDLNDGHDGGIVPDLELTFKVTDDDIHTNRQSKHHRHAKQNRFGSKPWTKFVFYYRSKKAMVDAGCVWTPPRSHALEPYTIDSATETDVDGENKEKTLEIRPKGTLMGQTLSLEAMTKYPPAALSQSIEQDEVVFVANAAPPSDDTAVKKGGSLKRSLDSTDTSPASTPAKKPRVSEKLAALRAALQEKAELKKAKEKAVMDKKKVVEEKQRERKAIEAEEQRKKDAAEAEEIARLQAEMEGMDEDLEDLDETEALLDAEIEEMY